MSNILVSGLINIETTLRVDAFPIQYTPVRYPFFNIHSTVSGVGYNVAKALTVLGDTVRFVSLIGRDRLGKLVQDALADEGISGASVIELLDESAQSVILFDLDGRRQINVDLKDIQQREYPSDRFSCAAEGCSLAVLCNINFSRPFLHEMKRQGILIATDVHAIAELEDDYNRDFMEAADILFMSHELLPQPPEQWIEQLQSRYGNAVVVVGMGSEGALISVRRDRGIVRVPAISTRPVVSSIGAGDALFSAFVHFYAQACDPYEALRRASVFASYKIGTAGAAQGFLDEAALDELYAQSKDG